MNKDNTVIKVSNLKKSYGSNQVLTGIDFEVERGTMLALLGPNGAGKTTTVRILSTLINADSGKVTVENFDVIKDAEKVRSKIGLTGQSASIDELLTGRENLIMMGRLYRLTKKSSVSRAEELLKDFDLVDAADRPAKTYSGGMRRRLDLAVSLIASPPIIFLDEPTTGLDPRSRLVMWDIIRNLMDQGTTILLTTQYLEEADKLADNIIVIDGGKVIAEGTAKQLKEKIGKDRLLIGFKTQRLLNQAKDVLKSKDAVVDEENLQLSLPIGGKGSDVRNILETLEKNKLDINFMDIHKPTLDDVFLSVTDKDSKPKKDDK
jgi:ABC-2 type transport system ATP-binding protein